MGLRALYEPPIVIRQLEVDGLTVQLATNAEGIGNWVTATAPGDDSTNAPIAVEIDKLSLRDIGFAYDDVGGDLVGEISGSIK